MRKSSSLGFTIAEVLVYMGLSSIIFLASYKMLDSSRQVSLVTTTQNELSSSTELLLRTIQRSADASLNTAFHVSDSSEILSVQRVSAANSNSESNWESELDLFWFDSAEKTILAALLPVASLSSEPSPVTFLDSDLVSAKSQALTNQKARILTRNVSRLSFEKTPAENLQIELSLELVSYKGKLEKMNLTKTLLFSKGEI